MHEYAHGVIESRAAGDGSAAAPAVGAPGPRGLDRGPSPRRPGGGERGRHRARPGHRRIAPTSPRPRRCPCSRDGTPLCRVPELAGRPHAYPKLWKHHAAQGQADRDQRARGASAASRGWRATAGGSRPSGSSPRRSRCSRRTPRSTTRMDRWIEGADWIVWQLCGRETRNACSAGYKAIYQDGAFPVRGVPARARRALRRLRRGQARRRRCCRSAAARAA